LHPSIYMPDPEIHYFSREYDRGADWYLSHFASADARLKGEKSNSYMDTPEACPRIRMDLPKVRLIAQLRNPIERAYSDYCMLYRRGEVGPDIARYLDPRTGDGGRFLDGGLYYDQLQPYMNAFDAGQLLVLLYESILTDPQRQLDTVATFLGLDDRLGVPPVGSKVKDKTEAVISPPLRKLLRPLKRIARPFRHSSLFSAARGLIASELKYPPLEADLRRRMTDYYLPQIEKLETIGRADFSSWLNTAPDPQKS
jgi:hypothetical protein